MAEIPRKIHQIWYQGGHMLPEKYQRFQKTWQQKHPKWEYLLWDEFLMTRFLKEKYPMFQKMYNEFQYMHQKIDFFKYLVLWDQGGVYADMDSAALKCLDKLFKKFPKAQVIVSASAGNEFESRMLAENNVMVNNGVIIASPKHNFLRKLLKSVARNCQSCNSYDPKVTCIGKTTGPLRFTKVCMHYLNQKDPSFYLLPNKYLEPCFGLDTYCKLDEDSYVNHQHEQTWVNPVLIKLIKVYYLCKNNPFIMSIISCLFVYLGYNKLYG